MTTGTAGLAPVGRYWREVEEWPEREHSYVALLGLRTYDPVRLHSRLEEGLSYEALERLRIPEEVGRRFRSNPATCSGASRPPIPEQAGHPFRAFRPPVPVEAGRVGGERERRWMT